MVIINKYSFLLISSLIILAAAVMWRDISEISDNSQVIIIENSCKTTSYSELMTTSISTVTTVISKNTISRKSTCCTNTTNESTEISEIFTKTVDLYIDINNADIDELIKLNGIGEYLAGKIIEYREENGGFNNIEEIVNVSGIGEKTFYSICDFIYVENPVYYFEDFYDEPEQPAEIYEYEEMTEEVTENLMTLENYAPINLNEADMEILMLLPCVDEKIAGNIIELRTEMTKYSHIYELLYVEGITEEMLSEIIEYVYI